MTAPNTPQLDSEELQKILSDIQTYAIRVSRNELRGDELTPDQAEAAIKKLVQADRAAFADRVLAVLPEKIRQLCEERGQTLQPDMILVPLPIHQVTTAITNLVAAPTRGDKGETE